MNGVDQDLTLEDAKKTAMSIEQEIAAMVPSGNVATIEQSQTGVLLSCDDERGYQWTGGTDVVLQGELDPASIVQSVVDEYSGREGFTAQLETTSDNQPSAHVMGQYGAGYLLTQSVDKTAMEILSFSPCFVLPDDMAPGVTY